MTDHNALLDVPAGLDITRGDVLYGHFAERLTIRDGAAPHETVIAAVLAVAELVPRVVIWFSEIAGYRAHGTRDHDGRSIVLLSTQLSGSTLDLLLGAINQVGASDWACIAHQSYDATPAAADDEGNPVPAAGVYRALTANFVPWLIPEGVDEDGNEIAPTLTGGSIGRFAGSNEWVIEEAA